MLFEFIYVQIIKISNILSKYAAIPSVAYVQSGLSL